MADLDIINSPETEKALLGCLMVEPEMIDQVAPILDVEDFYDDNHKTIYEAILGLRDNQQITYLSVAHALGNRLQVIGGIAGLMVFVDYAAFKYHAHEYARIIRDKSRARQIIHATNIAAQELSAGADLEDVEHALQELIDTPKKVSDSDFITEAVEAFASVVEHKGETRGIPTGYWDLDQMTGGFDKGELTVLAGRPSMGKTALAVGLAHRALKKGHRVLFASLEMTGRSLIQRMAYSDARVDGQKYNTGDFTESDIRELNRVCDDIRKLPLTIEDRGGQSLDEILARAKQLQPDIIIIDYLQLLASPDKRMNLYEKTTQNSLSCKNLAKNLGIPVVLLSQLSRAPETRGKSRRPIMADLRESGAIEQDADHVWLLYRPEVYEIKEKDGVSTENMAELIVAKNRNGPIGSIKLTFLKKFMRFENYVADNEIP